MKTYLIIFLIYFTTFSLENSFSSNSDSERMYYGNNYFLNEDGIIEYFGQELIGADPNTFIKIGRGYAKDKNNVYFGNEIISEADSLTFFSIGSKEGFEILAPENSKGFGKGYAYDKNNFYENGETISYITLNRAKERTQRLVNDQNMRIFSFWFTVILLYIIPVIGAFIFFKNSKYKYVKIISIGILHAGIVWLLAMLWIFSQISGI